MSAGVDLPSLQLGTEPAEDEEDAETPTNSDEQRRPAGSFGGTPVGGAGRALGPEDFQMPVPFAGAHASGGGSFAPPSQHTPSELPQNSDRAQAINAHTANQVAMFHNSRRSNLGASAADVERRQFGSPQG
jgi:hypothetical protein